MPNSSELTKQNLQPRSNFYATLAVNQGGAGYVQISTKNYTKARELIFTCLQDKWAFMYDELQEVHVRDRKLLAIIGENAEGIVELTNYLLPAWVINNLPREVVFISA